MNITGRINLFHYEDQFMKSDKNAEAGIYEQEVLTWERTLAFYKQENAYLKTRLSQMVDSCSDKNFLEQAEHFNNRLVFTDDYIKELIKDIRLQRDVIRQRVSGEPAREKIMTRLQLKLRKEINKFDGIVAGLKKDFNEKLLACFNIS